MNIEENQHNMSIPPWHRFTLTIEEAAKYYHIGEGKLRSLINTYSNENFYITVGNRKLIKRIQFEEFLNHATAI